MTVKKCVDRGVEMLFPLYNKEEAKALLGMVLEHFCGWPPHTYYTDPNRPLPPTYEPDLQRALDDLANARPIQYILGQTLFEGCSIKVREGVLIPRPETAQLVRWAKTMLTSTFPSSRTQRSEVRDLSILDLCTGSGAIAIALAKTFPQAKVYGIDISEQALEAARENSLINQVDVSFFNANILRAPLLATAREPALLDSPLSPLPIQPESVHLIISNPPYIPMAEQESMRPNVLNYEPRIALFVPDDDPLLFYRALADWGMTLLKENGVLIAEINERMEEEVKKLFRERGYSAIKVENDLNGKPRICQAVKKESPAK